MNDGLNRIGPNNDEYETPEWLFKALDSEFGFTFDAAANEKNALCHEWTENLDEHLPGADEKVFCNPPYSEIEKFVDHALRSESKLWVMLLPNRTDTGWFQKLVDSHLVTLRFFRKRVRFCLNGVEAESPRFGSIIAIVRP
jgi:phage N-6-adenine-methyltransferase